MLYSAARPDSANSPRCTGIPSRLPQSNTRKNTENNNTKRRSPSRHHYFEEKDRADGSNDTLPAEKETPIEFHPTHWALARIGDSNGND